MTATDKRTENRKKLQTLLRELFQFDSADLDFGIYRILNKRRNEINRFIERDLLDAVESGLAHLRTFERRDFERQVAEKREAVERAVGRDALDDSGRVVKYHELPAVKEYEAAVTALEKAQLTEETEADIFGDLYTFFERYYDDGDFVTKRRYSWQENKFYVPYNGEEVLLYWANHDQHYVKTEEHFTDYRFDAGNYAVWFRLRRADVPQDNVKDDRRYFVLADDESTVYEPESKTLTVHFEHRPISPEEEARFLGIYNAQQPRGRGRATLDRTIVCQVLEVSILEALSTPDLRAHLAIGYKDEDVSALFHHLNRYTARNTMDYFIHKDLGGFLRRELDFFLKSHVLHVDDLVSSDTDTVEHLMSQARVVRMIALRIIDFLAQIEDFQKRLFEKVKFVTKTAYCVTLDRVPEELYPKILDNPKQLAQWRQHYQMDEWESSAELTWSGQFDVSFLKAHPYMMVDTACFHEDDDDGGDAGDDGGANGGTNDGDDGEARDFEARLLAHFDDLDEEIDGVLIHGENWQALNLLSRQYDERIRCIHIDPPYNTQTSGFLYKNEFQHSSWLAMMDDRVRISLPLLSSDGAFLCHIDENEYERLFVMFEQTEIPNAGTVVWDKKNPMLGRRGVATQHEYILWRAWDDSPVYLRPTNIRRILSKAEALVRRHGGVTDEVRREFASWIRNCEGLTGGERAYSLIDDDGRVFQSVGMGAPEPRLDPKFHIPLIHPVTGKKCPVPNNGWSRTPETLKDLMEKDEIVFGDDETVQPRRKVYLTQDSQRQLSSVIRDAGRGKTDLLKLGLDFPYCHPVSLYEELLGAGAPDEHDIVLDFFAGSGTTAHAVINLNREDTTRRKYILVEVGEYFDTVLKPRIQKVVFSANWKGGVPQDADGVSHMFKYQRLESYEDTLNNIRVERPEEDQYPLLYDEFDDYVLHYMLSFETKCSPALLPPGAFERPFEQKLKIQRGHATPRETVVDLVETFHYLIGVRVRQLERHEYQEREYVVSRGDIRTEHGIEKVVVIWRDTENLDLRNEAAWAEEALLVKPVDRVYVNGPTMILRAQPTEITFRQKMEGGSSAS